MVRGRVEFDTTELGDFVIAKSLKEPLYHLAVVADDHEMAVTHIIRGEDHISNTPRQILIQEAIGAARPIYAHLPLILDSERKKLSKRRHGESVSIDFYKKQGYLPETLTNFLALLGWNPGTEQEIFSLNGLIKSFELEKVQKGGAIFDVEKLKWMNKEHLRLKGQQFIAGYISETIKNSGRTIDEKLLETATPTLFERIQVAEDLRKSLEAGEWDFLFERPRFGPELLIWKESVKEEVITALLETKNVLESQEKWEAENLKSTLMPIADRIGKGNVLWPLRVALSGRERSPDPFTLLAVLGREESLERLSHAISLLSNAS